MYGKKHSMKMGTKKGKSIKTSMRKKNYMMKKPMGNMMGKAMNQKR